VGRVPGKSTALAFGKSVIEAVIENVNSKAIAIAAVLLFSIFLFSPLLYFVLSKKRKHIWNSFKAIQEHLA
jgi:hypothetical protein